MIKNIFFYILIAVTLHACEHKIEMQPPENLIEEDLYIDVFVELHLLNAFIEATDSLMNQDSLKHELFKKYTIPENDFLSSHAYYQSQTQLQQIRLDSASARLSRTVEILQKIKGFKTNELKNKTPNSLFLK